MKTAVSTKWFTTIYYPVNKVARAAKYEEGVLPRLEQNEIVLFTPWGPRYSWKERGVIIRSNDKEICTLKFLKAMLSDWKKNMPEKKIVWFFLGADLYGSRINGLPIEIIKEYFFSLGEKLKDILPGSLFHLWSEFDCEAEMHRKKIRENFDAFVDARLLGRTSRTARLMARGGNPKEYLIERIAEAILIEEKLRPIKISCAPRHKDDKVDQNLPRLYFLPENLQAPWI
jgi:hypothetical protein